NTYFTSINHGYYDAAYAQLSPGQQARLSYQQLAEGTSTSFDYDVTVYSVSFKDATDAVAYVTFTSIQASSNGPNGDVCDDWAISYWMVWIPDGTTAIGHWYIDNTTGSHTPC